MNRKGFTIIELAIVIGILALILAIVGGFISSATARVNITDASTQVVDALRRAQWQTINGQDDADWSVHFTANQIILFKGIIYNPADPDNYITNIESPLTISGISLNGGGSDVIFDDEFGNSTTYGTITITDPVTSESVAVTINQIGSVDAD
ncbi:MAG: type II secretion system protein [Patescibacteria group bacterium]